MITWLGFIGNMIQFMANKLLGYKIDLALNDKKKAARTFLRLHQILKELEAITEDLDKQLDDPRNDSVFPKGALFLDITDEITRLTNDFLHLTQQLHDVLRIYDPTLGIALSHLRYSKSSLMSAASHSLEVFSPYENASVEIEYSFPGPELMGLNFEEHYQWLLAHQDVDLLTLEAKDLEWPQRTLLLRGRAALYNKDSVRQDATSDQKGDIARLRRVLTEHSAIISEANKLGNGSSIVVSTFQVVVM